MSAVDPVATGSLFLREGVRSFDGVLQEMVAGAREEILVAVYAIAAAALPFISMLFDAASRGVRVTLVVNSLQELPPEVHGKLLECSRQLGPLFRVIDFRHEHNGTLHAKVVIVDRREVLVGSANLTWGGMALNHEIGVRIRGEAAWSIARMIDRIVCRLPGSTCK